MGDFLKIGKIRSAQNQKDEVLCSVDPELTWNCS